MKALWCSLMAVLIIRQVTGGIVRKPPAFAAPMYSDSYLPACMQVIFHAVEQLKLHSHERLPLVPLTVRPSMTTQSMKHQPQLTTPVGSSAISTAATAVMHSDPTAVPELPSTSHAVSKVSSDGPSDNLTEAAKYVETSTATVSTSSDHEESPEVNEEIAETNYATPEMNHESPEPVQETQEPNQEIPEVNEEDKNYSSIENSSTQSVQSDSSPDDGASSQQSTQATVSETSEDPGRKELTIDSIVDEIYEIVMPTSSPLIEDTNFTDESKGTTDMSIEKTENIEDAEEETRFTLLGEKVTQVPRPSLSSYLRRRYKAPISPSIQQLADLYDALSKDARKQGFARYTGYSDEVLKVLQSSVEGGVGPQLKTLLDKVIERNELTRDDAKSKAAEVRRDLDDHGSVLNKNLKHILPLRYTA
ncbi:PREDICTED: uncharacterized protein LOC106751938 [Dinoponera quadriceps]|uniref:Uncharacterized protein LOC106751938 n=1 Tax=Dinoponera quadriceps TaxID=609295 RepID=A0A6P3YCE0_DINQU|nr:PREDICTED: uncharacterized protein LOC106751938 [Dinoponera quadriceps]